MEKIIIQELCHCIIVITFWLAEIFLKHLVYNFRSKAAL